MNLMPAPYRVFISCVSAEFKSYRETLRKELTNFWREVKVQEDFIVGGGSLLEKLDDYIRQCQALIHLIGEDCGCKPQAAEVRALLTRYSDFMEKLPELADNLYGYSYTQWEAYLAIYHNVPCFNYIADTNSKRETNWTAKPEQQQAQREHQKRLENLGRDRHTLIFDDARDVALRFLNAIVQPKNSPHSDVIVEISHLPQSTTALIGRQKELVQLTEGFTDGKTRLAIIVAAGGIGKSALTDEWLQQIAEHNYYGKTRVFGWSFYSQGSHSTFTNSQPFFNAVLPFLGATEIPKDEIEKARLLVRCLQKQPCLIILDGLEPLQYPVDLLTMHGTLQDSALKEFISCFRQTPCDSFVLLSSRQPLVELKNWRNENYLAVDLKTLSHRDGIALLKALGVKGSDLELQTISEDLNGHALSLVLMGHLLQEYYQGDSRYAKEMPPLTMAHGSRDAEKDSRHALRVLDYYDKLQDAASRCFLQLLGLFDRPMTPEEKEVLIAKAQHAEPLRSLTEGEWQILEQRLEKNGLLLGQKGSFSRLEWDTHPIIRAYFGQKFKDNYLDNYKQAHSVLFDYYQKLPESEFPETLEEMQPLYRAVSHGCLAGEFFQALEVYSKRILRTPEHYSWHHLGAYSQDLTALASFFPSGWGVPLQQIGLTEEDQDWLSAQASFCLMSLGRLRESIPLRETSLKLRKKLADWKNTCKNAICLVDLHLPLGQLTQARTAAYQAIEFSQLSEDHFLQIVSEGCLATVFHHSGKLSEAHEHFQRAEKLNQQRGRTRLPPLQAIQYFYLLLDSINMNRDVMENNIDRLLFDLSYYISEKQLLNIALCHLALARARFALNAFKLAENEFQLAIQKIHKANSAPFIPPFYLYRADFHLSQNQYESAQADLNRALDMIEGSGMKLYAVDYLLIHGRYCLAKGDFDTALTHYKEAKQLIKETGYHLRDAELDLLAAQLCQQQANVEGKNTAYFLQKPKNRIEEIGQWALMPRWEAVMASQLG